MTLTSSVAAGASGAIFGIAGAMLVTGFRHHAFIPRELRRVFGRGILPFIVLDLILGYSIPGIDNWGHLGGLASGLLLTFLIPPPGHSSIPGTVEEEPSQALVVVPLALVVVAVAAGVDHYRTSRVLTRLLEEGARFRAQQQNEWALERFREAARRAPRDERPHEKLGSLYLDQKNLDEAIREYNEALRLSPGSPGAQLGLVFAYRQKGDLPKARELLEAVVGKNPATPEGQQALADLCAEQKLYPEAIQHYQAALRMKPNLAEAHNNLAWLYATSEEPQYRNPMGALEHARRAVQLSDGKVAAFVDTLAEALYVNGNYAEAVEVQSRALALEPDSRELQEHMARYRKAAGV
jgi:Tfp pilus assembly protein PilF